MRRPSKIFSRVANQAAIVAATGATLLLCSAGYACPFAPLLAPAPVYVLAQNQIGSLNLGQQTDQILVKLEKESIAVAEHYARGEWDETIITFRSLIKRYPHSEQAAVGHFFLGEALVQTGEFADAYTAYQTFIARNPRHAYLPQATFRMGEAAFRLGRNDQALRMLEIFARDYPQDPLNEFALSYLGEIRLRRDEPQLAQRALETALQYYPTCHLANQNRLALGKSFQQQGADDQALRFYESIAAESDNPLLGEAELQIATVYLNRHELPAAQGHSLTALDHLTDPALKSEASYWLARTYIAEQNHARAFELLEAAVENKSNAKFESAIYYDAAIAALHLKNLETTEKWLDRLLIEYPNCEWADDALHLKIDLARKSNQSTETIEELAKQFITQFPHSHLKADVLETAGRAAFEAENYSLAIDIFQRLLADDIHVDENKSAIDRANWLYLASLSQLGLKDFAAAESMLQKIDFAAASDELKPLAHIALANARFRQKKFAAAIPEYENFLQLTKPSTKSKAVSILVKDATHSKADVTNDATNSLTDAIRARTELTICYAETERWAEAAQNWRELKAKHTEQSALLETTSWLAEKANQNNQSDLATECYTDLATSHNSPEIVATALSGLAWLKMEAGDTEVALIAFERLITEFPDSPFTAAAAMVRAEAFANSGDHASAAQMYGIVVRRFAETEMAPIARLRRAYSLHKIGKPSDLQEARTLLDEYLELPDSIATARGEALYQLGWVHADLNDQAASLKSFEELVANHPDSKYWPDAAYRVAKASFDRDEFETTSAIIDGLVDRNATPDSIRVRALFLRGEIASRDGDWEIVRATMERLQNELIDPPQRAKTEYWLAESFYRQQSYSQASKVLEALRKNKYLADSLQPWVCLRQAQCAGQQDRWPAAEKIATNGKKEFPLFAAHYEFDFVIARAMEQRGKLTDCRTFYQRVIDSPTGGATETAAIAAWRIAETYFHQEKYPQAIEAYHLVDSMFTYSHWRSAAMYQAGKCQEHLSNWQHAEKLYDRLIKQFPDSQYAVAAQKRLDRVSRLAKVQTTEPTDTQDR